MRQRYQTMALVFFALCPLFAFAQPGTYANLEVLNPQRQWQRYQGNIDAYTITVTPAGIYTEVGLFMNISDKGSGFNPGTNLEAVFNFSLPEGVIVNDSWLWVGDTIVRAAIIDRWTASNIYEEIVDRNQDPSILFKNTARDYELRIFPLPAGTFRRVKLNFLVPSSWTAQQVITALPFQFAAASINKVKDPKIRVWVNDIWQQPTFVGNDQSWRYVEDPELGTYYETEIKNYAPGQQFTIAFDSPMKDGVFLQRYENGEDGYYQMAFLPSQAFQLVKNASRDIMVLLHFNQSATGFSASEVHATIRRNLKENLQENDRFNVVLAGLDPTAVSDSWLPATANNIDSIFNTISLENVGTYNLPGLLARGVNLMKQSENPARVLLFANSGQEGEISTANQILDDLMRLMGDQVYPFYIMDVQNRNFQNYYANNRRFRGNEYFYTNLSALTQGSFRSMLNSGSNLQENTQQLLEEAFARIGTMDLYTSLQNGFCYNRYNLNEGGEFVNLDKPILQLGRYKGEFPFVVEAAGEYNGEVYLDALSIPKVDVKLGSQNTQFGWTGNYLQQLEKEASPNGYWGYTTDNKIVAEVIDRSIQDRILSLYTSFIALEPRLGGEACLTCADESGGPITNLNESLLDSLVKVEILPNPFHERVKINVEFRTAQKISDFQFSIFNNMGQEIKRFTNNGNQQSQHVSLEWDGTDASGANAPAGIYHFNIRSPQGRYTLKLVKY